MCRIVAICDVQGISEFWLASGAPEEASEYIYTPWAEQVMTTAAIPIIASIWGVLYARHSSKDFTRITSF